MASNSSNNCNNYDLNFRLGLDAFSRTLEPHPQPLSLAMVHRRSVTVPLQDLKQKMDPQAHLKSKGPGPQDRSTEAEISHAEVLELVIVLLAACAFAANFCCC